MAKFTYVSEIERSLLKRYSLENYLKDKRFLNSANAILGALSNLDTVTLSSALELITCLIKNEADISRVLYSINDPQERERVSRIFSLALIQQLANSGYLARSPPHTQKNIITKVNKKVIIVGDMNSRNVLELNGLLLEFSYEPIILSEQPSNSRTILEKLSEFSDVGYAMVVIESERKRISLTRPNPNVMLELGYLIGLIGREHVLCLVENDATLPTDLRGISYIVFKQSVREASDSILRELTNK